MTIIRAGLAEAHRAAAAEAFWDAFAGKLRWPLGPRARGLAFLRAALDGRFAISAVDAAGGFLGAVGLKTVDGGLVGGTARTIAASHGWAGAVWRGPLLALLDWPVPAGALQMDGLFVAAHARGQGVGAALMGAVEAEARRRGLAHVRLSVVDENPRARRLYERHGYRATGRQTMGPLRAVVGFAGATTMEKPVG